MIARIIVQTGEPANYADVLAAICLHFPQVKQIEFILLEDDQTEEDAFVKRVDGVIRKRLDKLPYLKASRLGRTARKVHAIDEAVFKGAFLIDASNVLKEPLVDIAAVALSHSKKRIRRTRLHVLTWLQPFDKNRRFQVDSDPFSYGDIFARDLFKRTFASARAATLLSLFMGVVALFLCFIVIPPLAGYELLSDQNMNRIVAAIGIVTGFGGMFLSYLSLQRI
jgi:hypothetical protein